MSTGRELFLTEADVDSIRSLLGEYVRGPGEAALRITFTSGEVFVLRYLSEVEQCASDNQRDSIGVWSGEILESENLSPKSARLFVPGSGIDFVGSEVAELEDEETGELIFSRTSRRM